MVRSNFSFAFGPSVYSGFFMIYNFNQANLYKREQYE